MKIEIKKSKKPIKYEDAVKIMENRLINLHQIHQRKDNDIWIGTNIYRSSI